MGYLRTETVEVDGFEFEIQEVNPATQALISDLVGGEGESSQRDRLWSAVVTCFGCITQYPEGQITPDSADELGDIMPQRILSKLGDMILELSGFDIEAEDLEKNLTSVPSAASSSS